MQVVLGNGQVIVCNLCNLRVIISLDWHLCEVCYPLEIKLLYVFNISLFNRSLTALGLGSERVCVWFLQILKLYISRQNLSFNNNFVREMD